MIPLPRQTKFDICSFRFFYADYRVIIILRWKAMLPFVLLSTLFILQVKHAPTNIFIIITIQYDFHAYVGIPHGCSKIHLVSSVILVI